MINSNKRGWNSWLLPFHLSSINDSP